eukprot:8040334-Lingulodinium_polyedra.AAC.1
MARFDLLNAACSFACMVTKWDSECDRRLHRLVCYTHSSLGVHLVGWVGNFSGPIEPHLYMDADFVGCPFTERSISGVFATMLGSDACFPITAVSKRQGC